MTLEEKLTQLQTRLEVVTAAEGEAWSAYQEVQKPVDQLIQQKKAEWLLASHAKRDLECAVKLLREEIQCQATAS